jgi:hypothetical protein
MISQYLSSLSGVDYVGEAALVLSFVVFLLIVLRVLRMDRERVGRLERLPFDDRTVSGKESTP